MKVKGKSYRTVNRPAMLQSSETRSIKKVQEKNRKEIIRKNSVSHRGIEEDS